MGVGTSDGGLGVGKGEALGYGARNGCRSEGAMAQGYRIASRESIRIRR